MTISDLRSRVASRLGIDHLNVMQEAAVSQGLPARMLLHAPTGTGKTLAFALPLLASLPAKGEAVRGVVIAPSRELVLQIFEVLRTLASPEYKVAALYGGHDVAAETASLNGRPDIIVATPGRLLDHLQRGHLDLHDASALVLDEYDKSLDLGFHDDMQSIVRRMGKVPALILTSATAAAGLPDFIDATGISTLDFSNGADLPAASESVGVHRVFSASADKLDALCGLLRRIGAVRTLVFVNHRDAAERVYDRLRSLRFPAGLYHGGMEQQLRERALILFENGTTPVLVATDLASRGLDIAGVEAVVHYHMPATPESWTHRNGRTGRQGASGNIYVLVSDADKLAPFVVWNDDFDTGMPLTPVSQSEVTTLYFSAGRKDKISRGDIAGFLIQRGGLGREEVGKIDVRDHCAYAAVPAAKARAAIEACAPYKIKNQKVRISQIKTY